MPGGGGGGPQSVPIIDSYTLLGSWPQSEVELSLEALAGGMQTRGVALSLVAHTAAIFYDSATGNRQVQELCAGHAPLLPVAVINPLAYPACLEEVRRCLAEGLRLFRLCPREHGYLLSGSIGPLREVLGALGEARLIMVDGAGLPAPVLSPEIAELFPVPTAVTVDAQGLGTVLQAASRSRNVWIETSALTAGGTIEAAVRHAGADRVIFGSMAPLRTLGSAVMSLQFAELSEADRTAIFEGNLRRALE